MGIIEAIVVFVLLWISFRAFYHRSKSKNPVLMGLVLSTVHVIFVLTIAAILYFPIKADGENAIACAMYFIVDFPVSVLYSKYESFLTSPNLMYRDFYIPFSFFGIF